MNVPRQMNKAYQHLDFLQRHAHTRQSSSSSSSIRQKKKKKNKKHPGPHLPSHAGTASWNWSNGTRLCSPFSRDTYFRAFRRTSFLMDGSWLGRPVSETKSRRGAVPVCWEYKSPPPPPRLFLTMSLGRMINAKIAGRSQARVLQSISHVQAHLQTIRRS
jgi:hypothetical protein